MLSHFPLGGFYKQTYILLKPQCHNMPASTSRLDASWHASIEAKNEGTSASLLPSV